MKSKCVIIQMKANKRVENSPPLPTLPITTGSLHDFANFPFGHLKWNKDIALDNDKIATSLCGATQLKNTHGLTFSSSRYRIYGLNAGKLCCKWRYLTDTQLGWCHWWQHSPDHRTMLRPGSFQSKDQLHNFCPQHNGTLSDIWWERKNCGKIQFADSW